MHQINIVQIALEQLNCTQKQLAEAIGVAQNTIWKWKHDNSVPAHKKRHIQHLLDTGHKFKEVKTTYRRCKKLWKKLETAYPFSTDAEIAKVVQVAPSTIGKWRVQGVPIYQAPKVRLALKSVAKERTATTDFWAERIEPKEPVKSIGKQDDTIELITMVMASNFPDVKKTRIVNAITQS